LEYLFLAAFALGVFFLISVATRGKRT